MLRILRDLYVLIKPGIVRGNVIHVIAGALLASMYGIIWQPVLAVAIGTALLVASACVVNNYIDRSIDARMKRTSRRPSVTGRVPVRTGGVFASLLGITGLSVLVIFTNGWVVATGIIAYLMYVVVYGWAKRHSVHSTLIGAIPGALPAFAGYVAVTNVPTVGAVLVFLLVATWQMPHFYAISIFRRDEYAAAGLPVLGVRQPFVAVRRQIIIYMLLYTLVVCLFITSRTVGVTSGLILLAGAAYWVITFFSDENDEHTWARNVFGTSLLLTLLLLVASVVNVYLPPM